MAEGQEELRSKHEKSVKELGDLKSRMGRSDEREKDKDRDDRDKDQERGRKCKWCKSRDHYVSDCPEMLKILKEKSKADEK
eukprot:2174464-Prymnesium_polylepis.1